MSPMSMNRYDMKGMTAGRPLVVCQYVLSIVTVLMSSCMLLVAVPMVSVCDLILPPAAAGFKECDTGHWCQ